MIEIVGERGYRAVTVRELARLAGVSTRAFYEHFEGKEDCFLRTYELVAQRTAGRIVASQEGEPDWREQLRLAFHAFTRELADKPHKGRLALVEALAAGPSALEQTRRAEGMFEGMVGESFARAPGQIAMPPLLIKGIVAGVASVARACLFAGRELEFPDLADGLTEWALCYRSEAAAELESLDAGFAPVLGGGLDVFAAIEQANGHAPGDERALILAAVAKLAATDGYRQLTVARIRAAAGVSRRSFDANFESVEDCFLSALELRAGRALSHANLAYAEGSTWPEGIDRALAALCEYIARDPVLGRLGFAEAFAPGTGGLRRRECLMVSIAELFRESAPPEQRPSELVAEASAGAIWGVLHHYVLSGQTHRLGQVVPTLSFLALAPAIGPVAAVEASRGGERSPVALQPA